MPNTLNRVPKLQARTLGAPVDDLDAMRRLVRRTHQPRRYEPQGPQNAWDELEGRLRRELNPTDRPAGRVRDLLKAPSAWKARAEVVKYPANRQVTESAPTF